MSHEVHLYVTFMDGTVKKYVPSVTRGWEMRPKHDPHHPACVIVREGDVPKEGYIVIPWCNIQTIEVVVNRLEEEEDASVQTNDG